MIITNGAYIIDSLGKILVTHPTNHPLTLWSIPKGLSEEGETSEESAIRETIEETSINLINYNDDILYEDLGFSQYKHKKKKLHGHLYIINKPLSEMDLNLKCVSTFKCNKTHFELPENDITKWETIEFAYNYLHESQKFFLEKIEDKLVHIILK